MRIHLRHNGEARRLPKPIYEYIKRRFMLLPEYLDTLRCFEYDGEVNGKQVKRVSIFSPKVLKEQNLSVKNIHDLEQHHNLLLFEGYIDKLGNAYAADRRPPIRKNSPVK